MCANDVHEYIQGRAGVPRSLSCSSQRDHSFPHRTCKADLFVESLCVLQQYFGAAPSLDKLSAGVVFLLNKIDDWLSLTTCPMSVEPTYKLVPSGKKMAVQMSQTCFLLTTALLLISSILFTCARCNSNTSKLDVDAIPPSMTSYARILNREMERRLQLVERTLQLWLSLHHRHSLPSITSTRARLPWLIHAAFSDDNPKQALAMTTQERKAVESGMLEVANEMIDTSTDAITGAEEENGLTQQEIVSILDRAIAASISTSSPNSKTFTDDPIAVEKGEAAPQ